MVLLRLHHLLILSEYISLQVQAKNLNFYLMKDLTKYIFVNELLYYVFSIELCVVIFCI